MITRRLERNPSGAVNEGSPVGHRTAVRPYVSPYPVLEVMSDFWDCRGSRRHRGIDLAGRGRDAGLGTPVFSMGRARVVFIGTPDVDPEQFGRPLLRGRTVTRGGCSLPVSAEIEGYGRVYFFTRDLGSWRSGTVLVTELLEGPLAGYRVRYLHLAAVHPDLSEGDEVQAGQEIGLLGGTAVMRSSPHLHMDAEDPAGQRIDLAPYLGLVTSGRASAPACGSHAR